MNEYLLSNIKVNSSALFNLISGQPQRMITISSIIIYCMSNIALQLLLNGIPLYTFDNVSINSELKLPHSPIIINYGDILQAKYRKSYTTGYVEVFGNIYDGGVM